MISCHTRWIHGGLLPAIGNEVCTSHAVLPEIEKYDVDSQPNVEVFFSAVLLLAFPDAQCLSHFCSRTNRRKHAARSIDNSAITICLWILRDTYCCLCPVTIRFVVDSKSGNPFV